MICILERTIRLIDHDGYLPVYAHVIEGNVPRVDVAPHVKPSSGRVGFDAGKRRVFGRLHDIGEAHPDDLQVRRAHLYLDGS